MEEQNNWNKVWGWFKDTDQSSRVFSTVSSFFMATAIYAIVQGVQTGFSLSDMFSMKTIAVGFAGGLGIPVVQENGMISGFLSFITNNKLFKRYRENNIEIADKINDYDFKRYFTKKINEKKIADEIERYRETLINDLKDKIDDTNELLLLEPKRKKQLRYEKQLQLLENELAYVKEKGVSRNKIKYVNIDIDDIFNFVQNTSKAGKDEFVDDSAIRQRRSNWSMRIIAPILTVVVMWAADGLKNVDPLTIIYSTSGFLFLLIYQWYSSYTKRKKLLVEKAIPVERNRNTLLIEAEKEYPNWRGSNENLVSNEILEVNSGNIPKEEENADIS